MKDMDTPVIAAPARGRRPIDGPTPATPDIVSDQTTRAYVDELRQDTAVMPKAQLAQSLRVAEAAGMITAFQYNETANRVAMLKLFAQIRDSKAYKGARVTDRASGETVTVTTWEEFCNAYGYSRRKIDEDLQCIAAFGGDFMEMQERLGLGRRDLRLLRNGIAALPPEERQAILDDVAAARKRSRKSWPTFGWSWPRPRRTEKNWKPTCRPRKRSARKKAKSWTPWKNRWPG